MWKISRIFYVKNIDKVSIQRQKQKSVLVYKDQIINSVQELQRELIECITKQRISYSQKDYIKIQMAMKGFFRVEKNQNVYYLYITAFTEHITTIHTNFYLNYPSNSRKTKPVMIFTNVTWTIIFYEEIWFPKYLN